MFPPRRRCRLHRALRRPSGALRPICGDTVAQPSKSITSSTFATTANAFSATNASKPAAWTRKILLPSPSPDAAFRRDISTEFEVPLPDSACVYCGNCIGVCPTGALMFKSEFDMRAGGHLGRIRANSATDTICPYCGVGCTLTVHAQDGPDCPRHRHRSIISHPRPSLHQRPLRLAIRADQREGN